MATRQRSSLIPDADAIASVADGRPKRPVPQGAEIAPLARRNPSRTTPSNLTGQITPDHGAHQSPLLDGGRRLDPSPWLNVDAKRPRLGRPLRQTLHKFHATIGDRCPGLVRRLGSDKGQRHVRCASDVGLISHRRASEQPSAEWEQLVGEAEVAGGDRRRVLAAGGQDLHAVGVHGGTAKAPQLLTRPRADGESE